LLSKGKFASFYFQVFSGQVTVLQANINFGFKSKKTVSRRAKLIEVIFAVTG